MIGVRFKHPKVQNKIGGNDIFALGRVVRGRNRICDNISHQAPIRGEEAKFFRGFGGAPLSVPFKFIAGCYKLDSMVERRTVYGDILSASVDAVLFQLQLQRPPADAENVGGMGPVAAGLVEGAEYHPPLDLLEGCAG